MLRALLPLRADAVRTLIGKELKAIGQPYRIRLSTLFSEDQNVGPTG